MYFSPTFDLTNPINKLSKSGSFTGSLETYDERFFYNQVHLADLIAGKLNEWIQPFMCGLVEYKLLKVSGKNVGFALIGRRDKSRAGMRFMSRGADMDGNVSNFAETEQVMIIHKESELLLYSYLQTRGSIPVLWKQTPSLKWAPKLKIEANSSKIKKSFNNHMNQMRQHYGNNTLVNLIDKKGSQQMIGKVMTDLFMAEHDDGSQHYVWFDFHHECRKMQWHNLSKLITEISKFMNDYKYTKIIVKKDGDEESIEIASYQNGAVRTNCMDCLDRTNVVQSVIARNVLLTQLHQSQLNQRPNGSPFEELPGDLEETFRDFWTKNADRMSHLYSGTGALKTDFTRTGKRTFAGKLEDGRRALHRYVLNNFEDTYHQNSLDFLLGKTDAKQLAKTGIKGKSLAMTFFFVS